MRFFSSHTSTKSGHSSFLYEKRNHLGNVLTVVSDRKIAVESTATPGIIDYYVADIISTTDTYIGGAPMPGRTFNRNAYAYGHNGQEKDDEIFEGAYTAEFWEYDSRIIRRWNVDPITKPWESPYACFAGNPVWFSDVNGDDATSKGDPPAKKGVPIILDNGDTYVPSVNEATVKPPSLIDRTANYLNRLGSSVLKSLDAIFHGKFHIWGTGSGGEGMKHQQDVTKLKRKDVEGMVMIDMGEVMDYMDPLNTKLGGDGKEARDKVKDDGKEEVISGSPDVANGLSNEETKPVLKKVDSTDVVYQTAQGKQVIRVPDKPVDPKDVNGLVKKGPQKGKVVNVFKNTLK